MTHPVPRAYEMYFPVFYRYPLAKQKQCSSSFKNLANFQLSYCTDYLKRSLKSLTTIYELSISISNTISLCFSYFGTLSLSTCTFVTVTTSCYAIKKIMTLFATSLVVLWLRGVWVRFLVREPGGQKPKHKTEAIL